MAPPILHLTDADRALITRARHAFRTDFHYLEQVLWQARARRSDTQDNVSVTASACSDLSA